MFDLFLFWADEFGLAGFNSGGQKPPNPILASKDAEKMLLLVRSAQGWPSMPTPGRSWSFGTGAWASWSFGTVLCILVDSV